MRRLKLGTKLSHIFTEKDDEIQSGEGTHASHSAKTGFLHVCQAGLELLTSAYINKSLPSVLGRGQDGRPRLTKRG
ncbi:hypothetical protein AAY473_026985 [Plecturocebus cupreus]